MTSDNKYVPLHVHDTYGSIGDSILKIDEYIAKAKKMGLTDLAITNHGSLATFVEFYNKCIANQVNPIIGCEVYFCDDRTKQSKENRQYYHLILLAKNYDGLKNIISIHNDAHERGFYYKPRTDFSVLRKYKDNIICLTACIANPIAKKIIEKNFVEAGRYLVELKKIFKDDLYLEIQPGSFIEQVDYNNSLAFISKKMNIPLVVTNDIHYLNKEDFLSHDYHVKDSRKMTNDDKLIYPDKTFYLMTKKELLDNFVCTEYLNQDIIKAAIENTNLIASKCKIEIPKTHDLPKYSTLIDENLTLKILCGKELLRYSDGMNIELQKQYVDRLNYELDVIKTLGFSGYFLIVKDIIDFCDRNNIARGPGRGSAAGSLVSFLLKISIADPIKYNLMFERFLSVHRKSDPDIDLDIQNDSRQYVYEYIKNKYGSSKCCFVSTYNIRKARNSVKSAARLLGYPPEVGDKISKLIPYVNYDEAGDKQTNLSIQEAYSSIKDFRKIADSYPDIIYLAKSIEGYPSSTGIHPAGVVINPYNIEDKYPLIKCNNEVLRATSLDLMNMESIGGIKFDLLALSSLSAIDKTLKQTGFKFDYSDDEIFKDEKVWKLIGSKNTSGLFQISSNTYKSRMPLLKPKSIPELAACLALVRGPCISSGADKKYIEILSGKISPQKIHPLFWEVTKDTYGIVIYQEQILKICMNIGFDSETSYHILKAISKKKIDKINLYKKEFYDLAYQNISNKEIIDVIWNEIENAGLYAFNIAHATSYALLCYCSAYLKTYFPLQYISNLLTKEYGRTLEKESLNSILDECKVLGIKFLMPDINKSSWEFTVENGAIRIGFCAIKGIGTNTYEYIKGFNRDVINSLDFFKNYTCRTINKKVVLILICAGVFHNTDNGISILKLCEKYMFETRKEKEWDYNVSLGTNIKFNVKEHNIKKIMLSIFNSSKFLDK